MPPQLRRLLALAFSVLAFAPAALGQSLLTNGSFESGTNGPAPQTYTLLSSGNLDITGWMVTANTLAWENGNFLTTPDWFFTASDGTHMLDLTGVSDNGVTFATLQQTFSTTIGQSYQAQFDLVTGAGNSLGPISALLSVGPASQTFTTSAAPSTATTFSLNFTANATSTTLAIQGVSTPPNGWFLGVDNVSVTAIPEPSSFAGLAGVSLLLFALRRSSRLA